MHAAFHINLPHPAKTKSALIGYLAVMEKVLITGGSGLLGTRLTRLLLKEGYSVAHLGRSRNSRNPVKVFLWNPGKKMLEEGALNDVDYIIHLAGEGIADKKWSEERKKSILKSRTEGPAFLLEKVKAANIPLKGFFSASGVNLFDTKSEKIFTEEDKHGEGFVANVVLEWEKAARNFESLCRVTIFRFGILLDKNEGALPKIAFPVQFGFGAALGSGKQWVPWLHIEDAARCFLFALKNENIRGAYNAVAPQHISNRELTKAIGRALHMPVILPPVPAFVLRMVFGELSQLVLEGSRISSAKLHGEGFECLYPEISKALGEIYS